MLINSLAGSSGVYQQELKKTDAKLQAAIASLVSGQRTQDVANIAVATQLQSQVNTILEQFVPKYKKNEFKTSLAEAYYQSIK